MYHRKHSHVLGDCQSTRFAPLQVSHSESGLQVGTFDQEQRKLLAADAHKAARACGLEVGL